jgi:type II secretory pathway component HofQ
MFHRRIAQKSSLSFCALLDRTENEDIQRMLGHFLTPDHGSASLEPQINTIVVSDTETVIPKIARYLRSIDVPRRQISVQVRVISITTTGNKNLGVDCSSTLGQDGLTLPAQCKPTWMPRSAWCRSGFFRL